MTRSTTRPPSRVNPSDPALPEDLIADIATSLKPKRLAAATKSAVFERIAARITAPKLFRDDLVSQREWRSIGPGVMVKSVRKTDTHDAFLVRIEPGCELPEHEHDGDEESVLLEGDAWIGDVYYANVGDSHFAARGSRHSAIRSNKGCVLYVRVAA